jgi:hypothetical protein
MAGFVSRLGSQAITTGSNHATVKRFSGFSLVGSVAGVIRFRQATVGGAIILQTTCPNGVNTIVFPGAFLTPGGVYVELVSGTFTEGTLITS